MPYVAADWSFDRDTFACRYIGDDHGGASPSYAAVLDLHRAAQALLDDATFVGDDELDITTVNFSSRSTDNIITLLNGWNIDDTAAEHLYDGSIIQAGGDTIYDGVVNFGNADVQLQIIQNGAVLADDWWNQGGGGLNADAAAGVSHRFMIKVRDAGSDIDGRRLLGTSRRIGKTYAEFAINGTSRGNNVLALADSDDLNNATAEGTIATWSDIVNTNEGYSSVDVDNNGSPEFYYSTWDRGSRSINEFYERLKWLTRDGSSETLYGLSGELFRGITHEIDIDGPTGTFTEPEPVSWTGGSGQLLAIDSTTAGTKMWIQLLTGAIPSDNDTITGGTSSATANVNVTVTERAVARPFVGQSTGSALIGSFGLGLQATDLTSADLVFDLTNTSVTPPNFQTGSVVGLVVGEDRVLVFPWDGTSTDAEGNPAIDVDQFTLGTTLNGGAETSVDAGAAIPGDTPSTGTIRVQLDDGRYLEVPYTSYSGSTFTITPTDFSGTNATAGNNVWIAYIDKLATSTTESFTAVYGSDRQLGVLVRDGQPASPIVSFIAPATFSSGGFSVGAIRTSDL